MKTMMRWRGSTLESFDLAHVGFAERREEVVVFVDFVFFGLGGVDG